MKRWICLAFIMLLSFTATVAQATHQSEKPQSVQVENAVPIKEKDFQRPLAAKDSEALNFYDKAILNDPIMQFDLDSLKSGLDQHVYKVREGSIGGFDSAGGSCGCN